MPGQRSNPRRTPWGAFGLAATALHVLVAAAATFGPVAPAPQTVSSLERNFEVALEPLPAAATEAPLAAESAAVRQIDAAPVAHIAARSSNTNAALRSAASSPAVDKLHPSNDTRTDVQHLKPLEKNEPSPTPVHEPVVDAHLAASPVINHGTNSTALSSGDEQTLESSGAGAGTKGSSGRTTAAGTTRNGSVILASKPKLLTPGAACQGIFPEWYAGAGRLTMTLAVNTDGTAAATSVRASSGVSKAAIERAARSCAQRLRFAPARGVDGNVVMASSVVSLTIGRDQNTATGPRRSGTI